MDFKQRKIFNTTTVLNAALTSDDGTNMDVKLNFDTDKSGHISNVVAHYLANGKLEATEKCEQVCYPRPDGSYVCVCKIKGPGAVTLDQGHSILMTSAKLGSRKIELNAELWRDEDQRPLAFSGGVLER